MYLQLLIVVHFLSGHTDVVHQSADVSKPQPYGGGCMSAPTTAFPWKTPTLWQFCGRLCGRTTKRDNFLLN